MDGYAVRAADVADAARRACAVVGARWRPARPHRRPPVGPGEAVRIMTGAPMPPGRRRRRDGRGHRAPRRRRPTSRGARPVRGGRRTSGRAGERRRRRRPRCSPPGTVAHAPATSACSPASAPRSVAVVPGRPASACSPPATSWSTTASPLGPGQIRDSNRPTLLALRGRGRLRRRRPRPGAATTRPPSTAALAASGGATCDALLTSGGVSMGDFDFVKVVLDRIGDMHWMQIAIRPAKPFAFGCSTTARARRAGVRPARQPGVVAGELRAVRPPRRCAG